MLSNAPLAQPFSVLQPFGADPALHGQILMNQQPLLGHEGLDLQAAPGTPVQAVQVGKVVAAVAEHERYGAAILLEHPRRSFLGGGAQRAGAVERVDC